MPALTNEQTLLILEELKKFSIPLTLNVSKEDEEKSLKECEEYIKTGNKNVNNMPPLSIYYIISKLPEDKQIKFIKENIEYIKEHNNDIFLYTIISPKPLSHFLSYNVIKELKNIDVDIFKKVISGNYENLFHGFKHEDYYKFYTEFYNEIIKVENREFLNSIYFHSRCCYRNINISDVNDVFEQQRIYNKEFMDFILKNYTVKINELNSNELLKFTTYIEDISVYKEFISKHYDKLNTAFNNIQEYDLKEYLSETNSEKQEILIANFFESIIKKNDIKKIVYKLKPNIILDLYSKNKKIFKVLSLNDWVKVCAKAHVFNNDFKNILDTFKIDNIEELFDTNFYASPYYRESVGALRYIETKYRNNIKPKGYLNEIDSATSIFSIKYLNNLSELKVMFQNKTISKSDDCYKKHLSNFILFLKNQNIINSIENNNFKEIEKLFYKILMGNSITILYEISSIEEIAIFNRLGKIDFKVENFTVDQLENYNVKHHKMLYEKYKENIWHIRDYKKLILKLYFMIGFNNTKTLLQLEDSLPVLEHLIGNVDVKDVVINEQKNPVLNNKLMNLLFSDKDYLKIKDMLSNKDNELYKFFPRILNEWEMIEMNDKNNSLKEVIEFLKSDEVSLPPKYYRLEGLFKYIGCRNSIVSETLSLHDEMLNKVESTIPRVTGKKDEYSYEMVRLDDAEAIATGNKTDCCFTVLGNGYTCLKHALTNKNGRIFVVKKDGEILAHSWVFRNGDLLCFDNIEISNKINCDNLFDIYLTVIDEIMKISYQNEGIKDCIKNVTIGFTNFDKEIKGIENYPCLIAKNCNLEHKDFKSRLGNNRKFVDELPQPIEEVGYTDSKNVQYLIRGNGVFNLGQSKFTYQDDRKSIMHYLQGEIYDDCYINEINKRVNALRYIKDEKENTLSSYKKIDVKELKEVYCNDDWYIISYQNGETEIFNNSVDKRAIVEINQCKLNNVKTLKKVFCNHNKNK